MDKYTTVNKLFKIANQLDKAGLEEEANIVSDIMVKISQIDGDFEVSPGRHEMFESDLPGEIPDLEIKEETLETLKNYLSTIMPEADSQKLNDMAIDFLETMEARARRLKIDSVVDDF